MEGGVPPALMLTTRWILADCFSGLKGAVKHAREMIVWMTSDIDRPYTSTGLMNLYRYEKRWTIVTLILTVGVLLPPSLVTQAAL
jgi:hypothetical protein